MRANSTLCPTLDRTQSVLQSKVLLQKVGGVIKLLYRYSLWAAVSKRIITSIQSHKMCILHNFLTFECIVYTLSNGQLFKSKQTGVTFFLSLLLFWKVQLCCTAGQSVLTSCLLLLPQVKALPPFRKRKYPFNPQTDHSRCCGKHFPGIDIWTLGKLCVKSIQPYRVKIGKVYIW